MFEAPERKGETITIEPDFAMERLERLADGAARNEHPRARDEDDGDARRERPAQRAQAAR
jgi:hypothetical protein